MMDASTGAERIEVSPTPSDEQRAGYFVDNLIVSATSEIADPSITNPINRVLAKLLSVSEKPELTVTLRVLNDPLVVNAGAGPGGHIYLYTGMLDMLTATPSEVNTPLMHQLALVLAHELAHAVHGHPWTALQTRQRHEDLVNGLAVGGMVVGGLVGAGAGAYLGSKAHRRSGLPFDFWTERLMHAGAAAGGIAGATFFGSVGQFLSIAFQRGYSRADEREADRTALQYLVKAQYDPNAIYSVLQKFHALKRHDRHSAGLVHHFSADEYPLAERLEDLRSSAHSWKAPK